MSMWVTPRGARASSTALITAGGTPIALGALHKLAQKNLSNLVPHPLYSAFYYSHPTVLERQRALNR